MRISDWSSDVCSSDLGNRTFTSYDGLLKVVVHVSETIIFGPELQVAKGLVDECLREWSATSSVEIRAIINRAFDVDQQGRINRNDLQTGRASGRERVGQYV